MSSVRDLLRRTPLVITGVGAFSAAGTSPDRLWKSAIEGRSPAVFRDFSELDEPCRLPVCSAPEVDLPAAELHPVRKMDRSVRMAWAALRQAWTQARLPDSLHSERIGIVVGTSRGPVEKVWESSLVQARKRVAPSLAAESAFAALSGAPSQFLKASGPIATVTCACVSGATALGLAAEQILLGKADVMLAGGAEAPLQQIVLGQLRSAGVLGSHADPAKTCRPFDRTRDGVVLGEGSAFVVLERAESAERRGVEPLARFAGWSFSSDPSGRSAVKEDGSGLLRAMGDALSMAGRGFDEVDYVNVHGTATRMNDPAEARAIERLAAGRAVPCSSTKPVTGHCLGATPALEAVLCILALREQRIPPTINCTDQDPACRIDATTSGARALPLNLVMSNSLAFWGYQACLLFARA